MRAAPAHESRAGSDVPAMQQGKDAASAHTLYSTEPIHAVGGVNPKPYTLNRGLGRLRSMKQPNHLVAGH